MSSSNSCSKNPCLEYTTWVRQCKLAKTHNQCNQTSNKATYPLWTYPVIMPTMDDQDQAKNTNTNQNKLEWTYCHIQNIQADGWIMGIQKLDAILNEWGFHECIHWGGMVLCKEPLTWKWWDILQRTILPWPWVTIQSLNVFMQRHIQCKVC